jgi:hypothetical protein
MKMTWRHTNLSQMGAFRGLAFTRNGLTLSLNLGHGSYSDGAHQTTDGNTTFFFNTTAEVAIFREGENHDLEIIGDDSVAPGVPLSKLPTLLQILSFETGSLTTDERIKLMVDCILNKED